MVKANIFQSAIGRLKLLEKTIVTIAQVAIRINYLALQTWERSEWKAHSMAKYGANPNFPISDAFFSSTKNVCWQVSLPPSRSGYCSAASSHGVMILGHFLKL